MADDIRLVINVEKKGVLSAITATENLEKKVKKLSDTYSRGGISSSEYAKGISQIANAAKVSQVDLFALGKAIRYNSDALKAEAIAKKALADAAKLEAKARRDASNAARDAANAARDAAKAARDAAKAAREEARVAKEAANAARTRADANRRLRMEFKEGYAAQVRLRAAQMRLSQAHRQGIITAEEYQRQLARLGDSAQNSSRHMSRAGVAMQQVGYQTGDFLVQVQSGQSAMVAFGQQATQMVGALYMLPAATLAGSVSILGLSISVGVLIASLGILIPLATAVGAAYLKMKKANDEAGKAADSLAKKIESLDKELADYRDTQEALSMGLTADQFISRKAVDEAKKRLDEAKKNVEEVFGGTLNLAGLKAAGYETLLGPLAGLMSGSFKDLTEKEKAAVEELNKAVEILEGTEDRLAEKQSKRFAEQKFSLDQELALQQAIFTLGKDSKGVKALELEQEIALRHRGLEAQRTSLELKGYDVDALKDQVAETLTLTATNENLGKQLLSHVELHKKALIERRKSKKSFDEQLYAQHQALTLLTIESEMGKDSVAYRSELVAQEAERLQKLLDQKDITEASAKEALALFEATLDVNDAIAKGADSAKSLADALKEAASAMSSLSSFGDTLDKALSVSVAKVQALKSGANEAIAGKIAGYRADLSNKIKEGLAANVPLPTIMSEIDSSSATISAIESSLLEEKRLQGARTAANKKAPKASTSETGLGAAEKLLREAKSKQKVIGLTQEQAHYEELLFKMQEDNAKKRDPLTQIELKGYADKIHAIQEQTLVLEEAKQQQEDLAQSIADSMGDAFMSTIDGTASVKDAFKSMASAIIKDLLQVLVIQRLVGSVGGGGTAGTGIAGWLSKTLPSANGNVFSGGSHVQAYANGGVVGGPTYFPMSGGKTGLMGEAGPEAIMPLKRGANGKLGVQMEGGGGDNVVINQSFNFQANGDDSVKKLIAQAAPKIAQMTKSSMLDDRRRGGQTKSVFG